MIELTDEQAQQILNALTQTPIGNAIALILNAQNQPKPEAPPGAGHIAES